MILSVETAGVKITLEGDKGRIQRTIEKIIKILEDDKDDDDIRY